jgi:hypothetical protein
MSQLRGRSEHCRTAAALLVLATTPVAGALLMRRHIEAADDVVLRAALHRLHQTSRLSHKLNQTEVH